MSIIDIFQPTASNDEYVEAVNRLMSQLVPVAEKVRINSLDEIVSSTNVHLFLLSVDGYIAGMCTLAFYTTPTGRKAWIEDVVVDSFYRGRHLGEMLVDKAIHFAAEKGSCQLMLTSRPSRIAANLMYQKLGFERKETNVYIMRL